MSERPVLTLIAAVSSDGFISLGRGVPWQLPRDKEHFRRTTAGHWLLIGRRTYEEMHGWFTDHHPLVLTHSPGYLPREGQSVASVTEAIHAATAGGAKELFVCGGGEAYAAALPFADRLILTHVHDHLGAGVAFPAIKADEWRQTYRRDFPADASHAQALSLATYERSCQPRQHQENAL
ncbi:dihydrofolate reductase [Prosthecobacter fluviatilis]|uniref:dihydrofolate reductase n=1 Tax=Prosthecobacter fluviatilis TaxID=445931 RepID=A0ABW0KR45_9BACT